MFTEMCCLYLDILIGGGICWLAVAKVDIFLKPANIPQTFFTQKSVHFRQAYKQTFDYQLIRPR